MTIQNKTFTGLTILAILLAAVAALFAANLLVVGQQWTTVQEIPEGSSQEQVETVETVPYPPAVPILLSALVLIGGLLARQLWVAWIGLVGLIVLSGLFVFSSGATLVPIDIVLLILLTVLTLIRRRAT
jgi:hypothetical protein